MPPAVMAILDDFNDLRYPLLSKNISLFFEKGQVVVLLGDDVVTSRTLEGVYTNYNQPVENRIDI